MTHLSNNPPPNPPHRHHYIPSFYLSRWATGTDGKLCQYSRPYDRIVPKRKYPSATGFAEKLYELRGLNNDLANEIETKFFSPVDNAAADALKLIEEQGNRTRWDSRCRTGWSMFLHSLLLRAPEDIAAFKDTWRYLLLSDDLGRWEERYQEIRKAEDPKSFYEHLSNQSSDVHDRSAMSALVHIMDGGKVAHAIYNMIWHIIDISGADFDFLTSDRPIIRTNGLLVEGGHLALPIGPRRLFVAARDKAALRPILAMSHRQLVRECNRQVCDYAVRFVYGADDSQLDFVSKHQATKDQPRLAQASADQRRKIAAAMLAYSAKARPG
ncbi:DUF4238 domain-containing protein [Falsirhodobacter halotolerans]|uniref:DUF4238 domain-containing protein n=1 Tax=Falsirhodobacter halotolerans TaxID=1146892 RepID=UPI001FD5333D|nr:DUF4238 domain-containing protein [Falsirhodobacter halotolerans]MCJ8139577.1 DUF4238 domain-containing protein [Falsirhodobacter halotolerans]